MKISINEKIKNFIQESYSKDINYFKKKNKIGIELISDNSCSFSDYTIVFLSKTNKVIEKIENISHLKKIIFDTEQNNITKENLKKTNFKRKKYYKKKYYKKKTK